MKSSFVLFFKSDPRHCQNKRLGLMHHFIIFSACMTIFLFGSRPGYGEPVLNVTLSEDSISIEETATLTIQIEWSKQEGRYGFALPELKLYQLAVETQGESQETFIRNGEEWVRKTFWTLLKPLTPGTAKIEGFELPYMDPSTQQVGRFSVAEQVITVKRPPMKILNYLWVLLLFLPPSIYFAWRWKRRREAARSKAQSDRLDPIQEYSRRLEELLKNEGGKTAKEWPHQMGAIFKDFLIFHYKMDLGGTHPTDSELVDRLRKQDLSREEINSIGRIFDQLHELKFTGTILEDSGRERLLKEMIRFIDSKRIVGNTGIQSK